MFDSLWLIMLGIGVGTLAGLLGVGGGIVMVPALLFLPPLWGQTPYSMYEATGISAVQAVLSGFSSVITHAKRGNAALALLVPLGLGSLIGGVIGGLVSGILPELWLYILFALLLVAQLVIAVKFPRKTVDPSAPGNLPSAIPFWQGLLIGGFISFISAQLGIGGAVLLLPVLIYLLHVSTRVAIGTGAGFVVITALSAVIGKALMLMIPMPDALWTGAGAFLGGRLGAQLSHRVSETFLHRLLYGLIVLTLLRISWSILEKLACVSC